MFSPEEILETISMIGKENFDIRAVTLGISLHDCASPSEKETCENVYRKICACAGRMVPEAEKLERKYGIPIINKRVSVTPISTVIAPCVRGLDAGRGENAAVEVAKALDRAARDNGIDLVGGYSALVHGGIGRSDAVLAGSLPRALSETERVCGSLNVATTQSGVNLDAVSLAARQVKMLAEATGKDKGFGAAKFVVLCNAPGDIPFMAGAFHGYGCGEAAVNVGVSGPGTVKAAVSALPPGADAAEVAEAVKRAAFKITRAGELVGRELAKNLGVPFGSVDLSLAPTTKTADSVAEVLEEIGLTRAGAPGSTAALYLLTNAMKSGGAMATRRAGGYSGAFIPVSEDARMNDAVESGAMTLPKLEAMTSVCSVGLDMIAIPGATPWEAIAAIVADEMAIGVANNKCTGARLIPVPGGKAGETVDFGGLFGKATIIGVGSESGARFVSRGGRMPAPIHSMRN
ncbi:MAG: PFL family protein [Candidatus ainarchaeum sp.]|nr:PFL family protein [Candidatus ainarchaeum sp.]